MATFPTDSVRTKNWGTEVLTDSDLEGQFDLLHTYIQALLNATTGHAHTGAANQGPKLSPANMVIASQAAGDTLYASSATAWARLAKGTAAQVLSMNAGATAPQWESAGNSANNLVRLDGDAKLPAVDGSALTNLPAQGVGQIKAWVNFDGTAGTPSIRAGANVSSITDNGSGKYTVNFTDNLVDADYACGSSVTRVDSSGQPHVATCGAGANAVTGFDVTVFNNSFAVVDAATVMAWAIR